MTSKTMKTVLFASLIAAMILPFSTTDFAFADVSPEMKEKARQGAEVWKEIKAEEKKVKKDSKKIEKLEKEFDKYVKELNKHGIATKEQFDADPQYWRSVNLPALEASSTTDSLHSTSQINLDSGNMLEAMSHGCGSCTPQKLHVISGYDYLIWGIWETTDFSAAGWKTLTYNGDSDTTSVTVDGNHSDITPHITQKIAKTGTVNYDYGYDARLYGTLVDSNNSYGINAIQVDPSQLSITEDVIVNAKDNTILTYDVDVNWGI